MNARPNDNLRRREGAQDDVGQDDVGQDEAGPIEEPSPWVPKPVRNQRFRLVHPLFDEASFYRLAIHDSLSLDQGRTRFAQFLQTIRATGLADRWSDEIPAEPQDWGYTDEVNQLIHDWQCKTREFPRPEEKRPTYPEDTRGETYLLAGCVEDDGGVAWSDPRVFDVPSEAGASGTPRHAFAFAERNLPANCRCLFFVLPSHLLEQLAKVTSRETTPPRVPSAEWAQGVLREAMRAATLSPEVDTRAEINRALRAATTLALAPVLEGMTDNQGRFGMRVELPWSCPPLPPNTWIVVCTGPKIDTVIPASPEIRSEKPSEIGLSIGLLNKPVPVFHIPTLRERSDPLSLTGETVWIARRQFRWKIVERLNRDLTLEIKSYPESAETSKSRTDRPRDSMEGRICELWRSGLEGGPWKQIAFEEAQVRGASGGVIRINKDERVGEPLGLEVRILVLLRAGVLLVDSNAPSPRPDRLDAKGACKEFLNIVDLMTHKLGLIQFQSAARPVVLNPLDPDRDRLLGSLEKLHPGESDFLAESIDQAAAMLSGCPSSADRFIVLLMQGDPQDPERAIAASKRAADAGISVFAVALPGANSASLRHLVPHSPNLIRVEDRSQLIQAMNRIADLPIAESE